MQVTTCSTPIQSHVTLSFGTSHNRKRLYYIRPGCCQPYSNNICRIDILYTYAGTKQKTNLINYVNFLYVEGTHSLSSAMHVMPWSRNCSTDGEWWTSMAAYQAHLKDILGQDISWAAISQGFPTAGSFVQDVETHRV